MPGYLNTYLEKKMPGGEWKFLTNVRPFIGSQGNVKYVLLSLEWAKHLEMPSSSDSLPKDISDLTKINMMSNYWGTDVVEEGELQGRFTKFRGEIGTRKVMKLNDINDFEWNQGISEENLEKLKTEVEENNSFNSNYLRIFKIKDDEDKYFKNKGNGILQLDDERHILDKEEVRELILNGKLEKNTKKLVLEKKTKKELLPQYWFDFLELSNQRFWHKKENIRFILYWTH